MTADNILRAAQAEEQRLVSELEKTPTYQQLEAIRRVIQLYSPAAETGLAAGTSGAKAVSIVSFRGGAGKSTTALILAAAAGYLREKRGRATSGELVEAVHKAGVEVGGKKPSSTLASYLSNSALFDNVKGQGYGLKEWSSTGSTQGERGTETPDSGKLSGAPSNGVLPLNS